MGFKGDPDKLVEKAVEDLVKEYREVLDKAYQDSLNMLRDGYSRIREDFEKKITHILSIAEDEIKSYDASKKSALNIQLQSLRKSLLDQVMESAKERIADIPEGKRREILLKLFQSFLSSRESKGGIVHVLPRDHVIMEKILEEMGVSGDFSLKSDLKAKLGGFKISFPKEGIVYDYTLDFIFESMEDKLYSLARKKIFGL